MNFQKKTIGIIIILIIAIAIGGFSCWYVFKIQKETTETGKIELLEEEEITSFEECVAKGYPTLFPPVLESYPRQCRALRQAFYFFPSKSLRLSLTLKA